MTGAMKAGAILVFLSIVFYFTPVQAVDNIPDANNLTYDIVRKGSVIGTHKVSFSADEEGERVVDIKARIRVKLAFITVFKLDHTSTEVWEGNQLERLVAHTKKNSKEAEVQVAVEGDALVLESPEGEGPLPSDVVPTSFTKTDLWSVDGKRELTLLDTLSGLQKKSVLTGHGYRQLDVGGAVQDLRYYTIDEVESGVQTHEFWIDDAGNMVKCRFITKDGDELFYVPA